MIDANFVQAIATLGAQGQAEVVTESGIAPFAVIPEGYVVHEVDERLERPLQLKAEIKTFKPESFIEYFNKFKDAASRVFVDTDKLAINGVLDYHQTTGPDETPQGNFPRFCSHRVSFEFRKTKEWNTWAALDRKDQSQMDFAKFIEDNLPDVISPPGSELLQVALTLESKQNVSFSSGLRLQDGQVQFTYEEEIKGSAQKGELTIPDVFVIAIAPFEGSAPYKITARLRWRIQEQALKLRYELTRPHKIIEDAVNETVATLQAGVAPNPVTFGAL